MGQVIKVDFRKAAPETAKRAPLDERGVREWREAQRANDSPAWKELGQRLAAARAAQASTQRIIPHGLGVRQYVGDWHANDDAKRPQPQTILAAILAAVFAA